MYQFKFTVVHQFAFKQLESYGISHQHLDLIFNIDKSLKIGIWNEYKEGMIRLVLETMHSYFVTQQSDMKIVCCNVSSKPKSDSGFTKIVFEFPIDKDYIYKVCILFSDSVLELKSNGKSKLKIIEFAILKLDNQDDATLVYISNPNQMTSYSKVHRDDELLGMIKPVHIRIRKSLCCSCEYYSDNNALNCAVNPYSNTDQCFDCKDYQLDSVITPVMYEKNYKFY
jgi:hypothetical protein